MATSKSKNNAPSTITLRAVEEGSAQSLHTSDDDVIVSSARRVRVGGAARDAAGAAALVDVAPDDAVCVEYENGIKLWMRADDLLRERGRQAATRSGEPAAWEIDTAPRLSTLRDDAGVSADRGVVGLGIKVLEFFGVKVAATSARVIGDKFELRQLKLPEGTTPGLFRASLGAAPALVRIADGAGPKTVAAGKPVLVFLHGTMSSVNGSFAALWSGANDEGGQAAAALRGAMQRRYGDQVYAFEHRTLTQSPIANALELARQLPVGAQLHLVSHSRGGLVGELMCLGGRNKADDPLRGELLGQLFAADRTVAEQLGLGELDGKEAQERDGAYAKDREALAALVKILDERRIQVQRFVRVACPARGTTLASGRLDRWLSVINFLTGDGLIGGTADFLLSVIKQRTDPRTLPGIEAMMPGSALTRLLHLPQLTTTADLSVICGDVQGKGLFGQLKMLALDWFYASDHDLVVNTGSMLGGIARAGGAARFRRDEGDQVNHFRYFTNKKSIDWLADALGREDGSDAGFLSLAEAPHEEPRWRSAVRASRSVSTPRPIAVMVPGTMGSAMSARDRGIWLEYFALMKGGLGDIAIDQPDVRPTDLLDDFYGPLIEHLTRTHRVEIFPYDWRRSVREAAQQLALRLEGLLPEAERTRQPIHIVAHSMGGLVSRAMIADGGAGAQAWRRMSALPGSKLLMLGTPNLGSHEAVRWLTGTNPTQAKLTLLDFTRGSNGIVDIVRRYPGLAELLPFDEERSPWGQVATWKQLKSELGAGFPLIEDSVLRQASATWKLLRAAPVEKGRMIYVAGCQPATVIDHEVVQEEFGSPRRELRFIATREGDGTVSWASGRLPEVPVYYAPDTGHDQLCSNTDDRRIFRGYVDLLTTGKTDQLPTTPPGRSRAAGAAPDRFVLPPLPVADDLPDAATVRSLGFGGGRPRKRGVAAARSAQLRVSIRHGDLRYARHPVLVGHYAGDTIVSAEDALDRQMKGEQPQGPLSRRRDLGLYPGPHGTHAVFFNDDPQRKPMGALVVGLGQVGDLSPSRLETGARDALLEYALRLQTRAATERGSAISTGRLSAAVSCLLVGTGAGSLQVRDSMEALLRGALAANRKLEDAKLDQQVLIDHVEFIELYEDLAISAAKELAMLVEGAELGSRLLWKESTVLEGEGRRQRSRFDADQSWWQRIEVTEDRKADRLRFVTTADRARAEEELADGQLRMADRFIAQACGSAAASSEVSKTLFEMLLPHRLKQSSPDQRDIVILLDEASARFPWELLEDRWSHLGRPPAVVGGIVRQLKTSEYRIDPLHAFENTAFVVGNPDLAGWNAFSDLPGARREAERVRELFARAGYVAGEAIDAQASEIVDGLHSRAWRVLHLAGHGEHEFDVTETSEADARTAATAPVELPDGRLALPQPRRKTVSGMVIGRDTFLTPGDVKQMRHVPELVFINCCHLGKTGGGSAQYNKLAANLGVEFIRMGVRAVVCAGWAVDDAAALTFAEAFYTRMLAGATFGDAVHRARLATWSGHPGVNTWGAYQCYGDPGYRLVRDDIGVDRPAPPAFFAPSELVTELRNLTEGTRMSSQRPDRDEDAAARRLRADIESLTARIPEAARSGGREDWLQRADVCAAIGFAFGEGRLFDEAVDWLDRALRAGSGDCPVRAAEQHANYQVRLASAEWSRVHAQAGAAADALALQARRAGIAERIEAALYQLDVINTRAPTYERLVLLGGACKRLAWVQTGRPRVEALLNMAQYYRQAYDLDDDDDVYAFNNWAVACLLLRRLDPERAAGNWLGALAALCERQIAATRRDAEESPQLWLATGQGDLQLVRLLLAADDAKAGHETIGRGAAELYSAAFARGASPREIASIQEHLDFLIALTADEAAPWPAAVRDALAAVRRSM
ncbi:CHAT domain-containing protein [Variovorax sp. YR752]|uniref:CHAT domain-containing protein n=1 Tax=Variovorax sp. YR752 TaxID=1884383 RepID=UPI0031383DFF